MNTFSGIHAKTSTDLNYPLLQLLWILQLDVNSKYPATCRSRLSMGSNHLGSLGCDLEPSDRPSPSLSSTFHSSKTVDADCRAAITVCQNPRQLRVTKGRPKDRPQNWSWFPPVPVALQSSGNAHSFHDEWPSSPNDRRRAPSYNADTGV